MRYRNHITLAIIGLIIPCAVLALESGSGSLDDLLQEGSLAKTRNPVPANFLLNEGGKLLTPEQRSVATEQLRAALKVQTSSLRMMMQGFVDMANSDSVKRQQEYARQNSTAKSMLKSMAGINSPPPNTGSQLQRDVKQSMIDPWVRGIEAARALEQSGDVQGAAAFYVNCLQFLEADWVPSACVGGIMGLGPRRASLVFNWMVDNADTISVSNNTMLGAPLPKRGKEPPDRSALQLRLFALEGLGGLVGGGQLATETREQTFTKLLSYATGKENEPFYEGAATGLGRTRDPRAVEPLRRLTKDSRPEIRRAAQNGLAAGFHDEAAIKALRSELGDHDLEAQLRAALVLLEINDETAIRWAIETVSHRRSSDSNQPDIRPEVVRGITVLGGPNARQELEQALSAGPGNDWLEAWIRVALLEMGDLSQMASVESALDKEDWSLDPRGFRSIWRSIQPLIMAAAQMALTSGMAAPTALQQIERAIQVIGNFAEGERARYLANADRRKAAIAQLRWQTADALGAAQPPGAAKILIRLLDDSAPVVRLSAAHALAVLHSPDSLDGIVSAFGREYGEEGGVSRNAEVYGALLRAALIQFPEDPRTRKLLEEAKEDKDPGVRFIGLTGLRPAS